MLAGAKATYNVSMSGNTVMLEGCGVVRALELKNELLAAGLIMDQDFVWWYIQARWDGFTGDEPSAAVFDFRDPAMATFYQLRRT